MNIDEVSKSFFTHDNLRDPSYRIWPIDIFTFKKHWDDWRIKEKIASKDALLFWDNFTNRDTFVENIIPDGYTEKDYKQLCEEIRLLRKNCDFE